MFITSRIISKGQNICSNSKCNIWLKIFAGIFIHYLFYHCIFFFFFFLIISKNSPIFPSAVLVVKNLTTLNKKILRTKGQLISKGIFAIFTWTKKRTIFFSISALKTHCSNSTFVGSSPTQEYIFSLQFFL